jgi:hypothetical protein
MDNGKSWMVPLTGIVFVVLAIVSFAIAGEPPDIDEGVQETVDFYTDNDSEIMFGSAIQALAATFFVFFAGYLYSVLRDAPGASGVAAVVMFGGAVIFATGIAIDATINFALAETVEDIDPTSVQALAALWQNDFFPFAVGLQAFLVGLAASVLKRGTLPKWIGWVAILFAVVAVSPAGFVSFIGTALLIIVISILLMRRARSGGAAPAAPAV